jgi:2-polyprenyl-6-methoxyphenol hydroxylase-like FAD-dependent oxidoreductase
MNWSTSTEARRLHATALIVGAGPVGLALACELGTRGIGCLLVEQGDGSVVFPAGEAINTRTMEHLRRWGIAERVRQSEFPQDYPRNVVFVTRLMGHLLARFERDSNNAARSKHSELSPECSVWCPKKWFDPLLREHAASLPGVELRYGWRMDAFSDEGNGVKALITEVASGRQLEIDADYLAACDGARSSVRRTLGIDFEGVFAEGHNFGIYFRSTNLLARQPHGLASQFLTMATRHRSALSTVNGKDLWRLSLYVQDGEAETLDPAQCVREAFGSDDIDVEIIRAQPWSGHRVVARSYRRGRVFLVGDAAHMLWPKGGFGANTGIGDAVDLGWKLAAVVQGWGGEALLASYEAERRPIGLRNVAEAASNRAADAELPVDAMLEGDDAQAEAIRQRTGEIILKTRWKEWSTMGVQLGYRYSQSPVIAGDGTPEPPDEPTQYQPTTWPGSRAPHVLLPDGRSSLDEMGQGFVLFHAPGADTAGLHDAARVLGVPLRNCPLPEGQATQIYERPLVLVRPDGHVAWRGWAPPADPCAVLAQVCGRESHPVTQTQQAATAIAT